MKPESFQIPRPKPPKKEKTGPAYREPRQVVSGETLPNGTIVRQRTVTPSIGE